MDVDQQLNMAARIARTFASLAHVAWVNAMNAEQLTYEERKPLMGVYNVFANLQVRWEQKVSILSNMRELELKMSELIKSPIENKREMKSVYNQFMMLAVELKEM